MVGQGWGACDPSEPRNRRTRSSIMVERGATRLLVDTTPDLRFQALRAGIDRLDAVLYTHAHADHLHGIDDLRWFNMAMNREIDVYGDEHTLDLIGRRFGYVFEPLAEGADIFYKPTLRPHTVDGPFAIGDFARIEPIVQDHGYGHSLGFRFDNFAYSSDVVALSEAAFAALAGLDLWIVDCLQARPHPTHAHLDLALAWIERLKPKQAILTHMSIGLDYAETDRRTPAHVTPAYDGMVLTL